MKKHVWILISVFSACVALAIGAEIYLNYLHRESLGILIKNEDSQSFILDIFVSEKKFHHEVKYGVSVAGAPKNYSTTKWIYVPLKQDERDLSESDLTVSLELLTYPEGKVIYRRILKRSAYDGTIQGGNGDPPLILPIGIKMEKGRFVVFYQDVV
jgi:hypothetical protein